MNKIKSIFDVFKREIIILGKDHSLLLTMLIAPVLYFFFYGSIYINKEEEKVKIAVVDNDRSCLSRTITNELNKLQIADVFSVISLDDAKNSMYKGDCQGYLFIEKGLENKVLSLSQANIVLAVNAGRFLPSSDLLAAVTKVCLTVGAGVRLKYFEMNGLNEKLSLNEAMPVNLDYRPLFNEQSSYGSFLLPGLLMLILQQTLLLGLAGSMSREKSSKTLKDYFTKSKENITVSIAGKGLFYFLLYCTYVFFVLTVNYSFLNLPFNANVLSLSVVIIIFLLTIIFMAIFLGTFFSSQLLCMQIMAFSSYPIFLITGYSWPFDSMPKLIQWLSMLLPTTPFLKVFVSMVQQGGTVYDNNFSIIHMLLLMFLFFGLCYYRLLWMKNKQVDSNYCQ